MKHIEPVAVTPVDTAGTVDAFIGSFARFHVGGDVLEVALGKAARYAAASVTRRGTQKSYATEGELLAARSSGCSAPLGPTSSLYGERCFMPSWSIEGI